MSYKTFQEMFDANVPVPADKVIYQQLKMFRISWSQKSSDYIDFLGSNLTGVYPIRFSSIDENALWDIFGVKQSEVQKEIYKIKGVNKDFKTISNATNVLLVYYMHKFINSPLVDEKIRVDAVKELYYILAYKVISSLTSHYFKYNIDVTIAKAVNERMTPKYLIRKYGSWQGVFDFYTTYMFGKGIHADRIVRGTVDDLVRVISDLQTKIREVFKNNYALFMEVKEQNEKIYSSTLVEEEEGEESIRDLGNRKDIYINYLKELLDRKTDFIKEDIMEVTCGLFKVIEQPNLHKLLNNIVDKSDKKINEMLSKSFIITLDYLNYKGIYNNYIKQLYDVMMTTKSYWMAANHTSKETKKLKADITNYVKRTTRSPNRIEISNLTVALVIYITVRAFFLKKED